MTRKLESPRSAEAILAREERQTLAALQAELEATGEELCAATHVRAFVRTHPELAVAASALLGALLAPAVGHVARVALPAGLAYLRRSGLARGTSPRES